MLGEYAEFGEWSLAYCPVIDDATMPRHPIAALTDTSLETMIGWTRDEASFAFALDPQYAGTTSGQVTAWAAKRHPGRAEDLYHAYAAAHPGRGPAGLLSQIVTDELFRCGGLRVAGERARTRPVRVYQFEVTSPLAAGALGATHCLDLPFTFASMDRWAGAPFVQGLRNDVTGRVTGALHDAWIAFARDGDPSHPGIPPWHPYDTEGRAVLVITDDDIRVVPGPPVPAACTGERGEKTPSAAENIRNQALNIPDDFPISFLSVKLSLQFDIRNPAWFANISDGPYTRAGQIK